MKDSHRSLRPLAATLFATAALQIPVQILMGAGLFYSGIAFNELIVLAGVPLAAISIFRLDLHRLVPFRQTTIPILITVVIVMLSADVLIDYLTAASEHFFPPSGWIKQSMDRILSVSGLPEFAAKLFLLCALPAACEEVFFRGFCQTTLTERWGSGTAIFLTALLFAAMHLDPWHFHLYFLLGLILGRIYAATGTLWTPVVCHFINNLWTFICNLLDFKLPLENPFDWRNGTLIVGASMALIASLAVFRRLSRVR